jgi:hypothetical protein
MKAKDLRAQADELFGKRSRLMTLHQELAENFYPERADFTLRRDLGDEFAEHLSTSFPVICRRDLAGAIGTMTRPTQKPWFHMSPVDGDRETNDAKRWLQRTELIQRRAMYDRASLFTRAMKEGDNDYASFGQTVISCELSRMASSLLYRCWHLRDVAWKENDDGKVGSIYHKWKRNNADLYRMFGDRVHSQVKRNHEKKPFEEVNTMRIVVESEMYDGEFVAAKYAPTIQWEKGRKRFPYVVIYYDCDHDHLMEAVPSRTMLYNVARWQTVSGSQYAYSPASIVALPDARMIQAMTYTLLEAGEKITNPPMVATQEAVRSDIAIYAGGVTWVDMEYDEKLGEALRPLTQDVRGMPIGMDMLKDTRALLTEAFYLNKIRPFNPASDPQMTAYQAGQIVQEYIRNALPIFEPMEYDYTGGICELTFDTLLYANAFGPVDNMPEELRGADIQFRFESPLHDAIEQMKGQKFLEMKGLIAEAAAMDPNAAAVPDVMVALRDALNGISIPAKWARSESTVQDMVRQKAEQQRTEEMLANMQTAATISKDIGAAERESAQAQAMAA